MSIAFLTELHRPLMLRELKAATEAILPELLGMPNQAFVIRTLDAEHWWKHRTDRPMDPALLDATSHGPDVPEVLFTLDDGLHGCMVSLGVVTHAGELRSCLSITTAIAVALAAARGWGSDVNPPDTFCPHLPMGEPNEGRPVEEVIACLRLPPADRSLQQAVRPLLQRTVYPCEEPSAD